MPTFVNVKERTDMTNHMNRKKILSSLLVQLLIISMLTTVTAFYPYIPLGRANSIPESWHNTTTLNVTNLEIRPRLNWYDFQYHQGSSWVSKRDAEIDVNNSAVYRFIFNISSDQGWADIDYINLTAWYDQGSESTTYNDTLGGNFNIAFQYVNTTGTAVWRLLWPHGGEITASDYRDIVSNDPYGSPGFTECHNISFWFTPSYQIRYAPGDGAWDTTGNTTNDADSWNFFVNITDAEGNYQTVMDEFGVYSYTEIVSAGWPTIIGNPGTMADATSNITIVTRSNGFYSFSVDVGNLTHRTFPGATMSRDNVWVRGGDLDTSQNFTALSGNIFFYGSDITYHAFEANGTSVTTSDVEYRCDIPLGQMAGDYTAPILYHLTTT
jgi:hypothetical protein